MDMKNLSPAAKKHLARIQAGERYTITYGPWVQLAEAGLITGPQAAPVLVEVENEDEEPPARWGGYGLYLALGEVIQKKEGSVNDKQADLLAEFAERFVALR